ncbi:Tetratricopeptide TPR-1 [Corchorus olitorius]|uniref:Tetratricopeptide TPR-1 n=1 Tax=Corchorus olitorius TaxID=93759 RepID=A0A1R3KTF3_9ROSI|nr:Tetratricopeptide TPR-1 [Corchorus olitorius]
MEQKMLEVFVKPEVETFKTPPKVVVLADLNVNPPESDDHPSPLPAPHLTRLTNDDTHESSQEKSTLIFKESEAAEGEGKKLNKLGKCRSRITKADSSLDGGADAEGDQPSQGAPSSRFGTCCKEDAQKCSCSFYTWSDVSKAGSTSKAYEKAAEILLRCEPEVARPELLSLVQIHHAQCLLLETSGDNVLEKELEREELEEILSKLKESMQSDIRQAGVWNTLGLILLKTGRLQSAIAVLSSLLTLAPDNYDCLGNLGIAYLQSGNLELSARYFQDLIMKDQNHPAALMNYAAILLCKCGSVVAGAGANASEGASGDQVAAVNVAKECLLAALKSDPKAAHTWANLANAYFLLGDHRSSSKCLEKAAKLEPNCMSTRYSVAVHRIKDVERSQDPSEQLSWAGNEMASVLREGDSVPIEPPIAWAGLAMVHKAQHEIVAAFETEQNELVEVEERAIFSLKQATAEDPDDAAQWNQLGLHSICSRQFKTAQKYLKAAVVRSKGCSYAWSNLGISLQLSEEPSEAESVYKRALSLATKEQAHAIFSNLGNVYRRQKQYERAKAMFTKSLELQPGYAPAFNNLGLVFVAEGEWEEAKYCFEKALESDPLLDAAKSNMIKAVTLCTQLSQPQAVPVTSDSFLATQTPYHRLKSALQLQPNSPSTHNATASAVALRIRPGYSSYNAYIQRQLNKTLNPKLRKIWTTRDWDRKVRVFLTFFDNLKRRNLLFNDSKALSIGARVGQEVAAMKLLGVSDSVGMDLVPYPPLVVKGDFHAQPFQNQTFDFEFSNVFDHALYPSKFVGEIERTLKPAGVCVLHVALSRRADKYSANDLYSVEPLVDLFKESELVEVRKVDGFGLDTEVVFRKKKMMKN